jgi:hypothetical protein
MYANQSTMSSGQYKMDLHDGEQETRHVEESLYWSCLKSEL